MIAHHRPNSLDGLSIPWRNCGCPSSQAPSDCLCFHEAQRSMRSAGAAQVRLPLRRDTPRSARYGERLAPLRALLDALVD